jgi:para-nitrobenzyl esterase
VIGLCRNDVPIATAMFPKGAGMGRLAACLALLGAVASARAGDAWTVSVTGGEIRGRSSGSGAVFVGIPFARPPVGAFRWQPPGPVEPWSGVCDATAPAFDEWQPDEGWNHPMVVHASEDCLNLNILAPSWPATRKLPVIVFVHGGGNFAGGAWEHPSKGVTLQDEGVVLVTVNYRLGIFGFFAHPGLTAESPQHASGNYGLEDLVSALAWVKGNIAAFGGDAGNVTMMGQSAGALDICLLMASERARGLFEKAIIESAPGLGPPETQTLSQAESEGVNFASALGCADIGSLRRVPAADLLAGAERAHLRGRIDVDGWMLREPPATTFSSGRESVLPMLIGTNARESSFGGTAGELRDLVLTHYGAKGERALELYGLTGSPEASEVDPVLGDAGARFLTDTTFRLPTLLVAQWHHTSGAHVWLYVFSQTPRGREAFGASHSSEMPYVFGELGAPRAGVEYGAGDRYVSSEMKRRWANFASTGDPNGPGLPAWPPYDARSRAYIEFKGSGSTVGSDLRQEYFRLFREDFEGKLPR